MKKSLYFVVGTLLIGLLLWAVPKEINARKNVQNTGLISWGMSKEKVVEIMGDPDTRRLSYFEPQDSLYYYQPPFGASDGIEIIFNQEGKVKQVFNSE